MSEHTVYAHGGRNEGESDEMAARRLVREHIGAHARNARVTQVDGNWVMGAAEVDVLTRPDGARAVMVRDVRGALAPMMLPSVERGPSLGRSVETARLSSPVDADGAPMRATSD